MEQVELNIQAKKDEPEFLMPKTPAEVTMLRNAGAFLEYYHNHYNEWYPCHPGKNYDFNVLVAEKRVRADPNRETRLFQVVKKPYPVELLGGVKGKYIVCVIYAKTLPELKSKIDEAKAERVGSIESGYFPKGTSYI